jgi:hypothetical protein
VSSKISNLPKDQKVIEKPIEFKSSSTIPTVSNSEKIRFKYPIVQMANLFFQTKEKNEPKCKDRYLLLIQETKITKHLRRIERRRRRRSRFHL